MTRANRIAGVPRIVYWNNIPTPYMVERFNAISAHTDLDFEAWFSDRIDPERSWDIDETAWQFRYHYLRVVPFTRGRRKIPPLLYKRRPALLVLLYGDATFTLGWAIARVLRVRIAFWSMITFDSWLQRRPWKERLKRIMFRRVDATLSAGHDSRLYAQRYGIAPERTFLLPHATNVHHFASASSLSARERDEQRRSLGLEGTTFIYVGRLWHGKGIEYLITAAGELGTVCDTPISLLLVGDGPEEHALREQCQQQGVAHGVFTGFVQKQDLPLYYGLADVFVFPTLGDPYGLVVDEAMACSLPVISTSAAGEIMDRISDGENGFVVPPMNSRALMEPMRILAEDPVLRQQMGATSAKKMDDLTPERWAETFEALSKLILTKPRIRPRMEHSTSGAPE
jgi:glycosyltransferase involved in cell wall biosynthesis